MVNISDEDFTDEFDTFCISVDDTGVIDRLRHICQIYRLSAENIVEEWMAFCSTKKQSKQKVTTEMLEHLERERLSKNKNTSKTPVRSTNNVTPRTFNADNLNDLIEADDNVISTYCTPTTSRIASSKKRQHTTPENTANKRHGSMNTSMLPPSPGCFTPPSASATPSQKYASRSNSGEVVLTFGEINGVTWTSNRSDTLRHERIQPFDSKGSLSASYKYMFQKLPDKAHVLNDLIEDMAQKFEHAQLIQELSNVASPVQESVTVLGRVCCDSNGKLNPVSVVLEGSRQTSGGKQIKVDLTAVNQYSLFPGQVVAMEGINSSGSKFVASKIHDGLYLPLPDTPTLDAGDLSIVIASGPFTTSDNLLNEPLSDLLAYLDQHQPDICILLGPFVDVKHPDIEKCSIDKTFEEMFHSILLNVVGKTKRCNVKLVLVPSQRDVHHEPVYPQPPFLSRDKHDHVVLVSDPCMLNIDGVVVGITSSDIVLHLGAEEISSSQEKPTDRISRLLQHILTQHTYYPLYPPVTETSLDADHFDAYCRLPITPHLLIIPSDLRGFIKDVGETVCINPGRLAKGQIGGTFARLVIRATSGSSITNTSFLQRIAAQLVRI